MSSLIGWELRLEVYPDRPDAWASYRLRRRGGRLGRLLRDSPHGYVHVVSLHDWARMAANGWETLTPEVNDALDAGDWAEVAVNMLAHEWLHLAVMELAFRAGGEGRRREAMELVERAVGGIDSLIRRHMYEDPAGAPWYGPDEPMGGGDLEDGE